MRKCGPSSLDDGGPRSEALPEYRCLMASGGDRGNGGMVGPTQSREQLPALVRLVRTGCLAVPVTTTLFIILVMSGIWASPQNVEALG